MVFTWSLHGREVARGPATGWMCGEIISRRFSTIDPFDYHGDGALQAY
jgi:hypothetical protein